MAALQGMADAAGEILLHEHGSGALVDGGGAAEGTLAPVPSFVPAGTPHRRRLCLCLGNCASRHRHDAGTCGKQSVADRPLCSMCKAHGGTSTEKGAREKKEVAVTVGHEQLLFESMAASDGRLQGQLDGDDAPPGTPILLFIIFIFLAFFLVA